MQVRARTIPLNAKFTAISSTSYSDASPAILETYPQSVLLLVGATLQLGAIVRDSVGFILSEEVVSWVSSVTGVATVSSTGVLTGVSEGATQITAIDGALTSIAITVVVANTSAAFVGATLTVYTGPKPASLGNAPVGDALIVINLHEGDICSYLDSDGNNVYVNVKSLVGLVTTPGLPQSARLSTADGTPVLDLSVGTKGSDIVINYLPWQVGDTVEIAGISFLEEVIDPIIPGFFSRVFDYLFG